MDLRKLKTLIDLVAESGIAELEITEGDGKVRIVKAPVATAGLAHVAPLAMPAAPVMQPAASAAAAPGAAPPADTATTSVVTTRRRARETARDEPVRRARTTPAS